MKEAEGKHTSVGTAVSTLNSYRQSSCEWHKNAFCLYIAVAFPEPLCLLALRLAILDEGRF